MVIKVCNSLILTGLLFITHLAYAETYNDLDGSRLDRIIAIVEEDIISEDEFKDRLTQFKFEYKNLNNLSEKEFRNQVLETLISERIQLEQARKTGIKISDQELNKRMEDIAAANKITLREFRNRLLSDGINYVNFREQIRNQLIVSQLQKRQVNNKIRVTENEIDDLLTNQAGQLDKDIQYHLRHILIRTPEVASTEDIEQAEQEITQIREAALKGENFEELAAKHSDGQFALKGGDLGWRYSAELPSSFSREITLLNNGDVSNIIRSPSGFHLLKLIEKRGEKKIFIDQTRARHILITPDALLPNAEALARITSLRNRIINGESFSDLAKANSQDTGSAIQGGDLEWINPGEMVQVFEEQMNKLNIGDISQPFKSQFGWHIVQVTDRRQHDNTRELLRSQARKFIYERKLREESEIWLRKLRDEAYVKIIADDFKTDA